MHAWSQEGIGSPGVIDRNFHVVLRPEPGCCSKEAVALNLWIERASCNSSKVCWKTKLAVCYDSISLVFVHTGVSLYF